jgi:hypothetical protein
MVYTFKYMSNTDQTNKTEGARGVNPSHPVDLRIDGSPLKRDAGNSALQTGLRFEAANRHLYRLSNAPFPFSREAMIAYCNSQGFNLR